MFDEICYTCVKLVAYAIVQQSTVATFNIVFLYRKYL